MKAVSLVHMILEKSMKEGMVAIDATAGNGHDTLFLARRCGANGEVYAFDIQAQAISATELRLKTARAGGEAIAPVNLCNHPHEKMNECLPGSWQGGVGAIMFNLGYLPGGDKAIITRHEKTIIALELSLSYLAPAGKLAIVLYPGHEGGDSETESAKRWAEQLANSQWKVWHFSETNRLKSPQLLLITRNLTRN